MDSRKRRRAEEDFLDQVEDAVVEIAKASIQHRLLPVLYILADWVKDEGNVVFCVRAGVGEFDAVRVLREVADRLERGETIRVDVGDN